MGNVTRLYLRAAARTAPKLGQFSFYKPYATVRVAVLFAVLKYKRVTFSIFVRCGARSNTIKRNVKINGSVRFTLLTVRLKHKTLTFALAVKKVTVH